MAVIYKPPVQDFGSALGQGVSQGIESFTEREIKRQEQQLAMQKQMQAMNAIKDAPDRETALGVLTIPGAVNSPQELVHAMRFVDALHPPKDDTPEKVAAFDQNTGVEVDRFVPKGKLPGLNDPAAVEGVFGKGVALNKPAEVVDFYKDGKFTRRAPADSRQDGEMTLKELELDKADKNSQRADIRLAQGQLIEKQKVAAEGRAADAQARLAQSAGLQASKTYASMVADNMNLKKTIGADGTVTIDWSGEDDSKKQAYFKMLDAGPELLDKYDGDKSQVLKAVREARKQFGVEDKKPVAAPTPAPTEKKGGGISDLVDKLSGKKKGDAKTKYDLEKKDGAYVIKSDSELGLLQKGDDFIDPSGKRWKKK